VVSTQAREQSHALEDARRLSQEESVVAHLLAKPPPDLEFQLTSDLPRRNGWWCKEWTSERYPDLKIRVMGRKREKEITLYLLRDEGYRSLAAAYTALMERRVRRVVRG